MLKIIRNQKAQNTAEYAILIALVIGAVVAMQTYAQRALQGRIRAAAGTYMKEEMQKKVAGLGTTGQYEPYYTCSESESTRNSDDLFNETGSVLKSNVMTSKKEDYVLRPKEHGE